MGILELLAVEAASNTVLGLTVYRAQHRAKVKASLLDWKVGPTPTPVIDGYLRKMSGTPSNKREKKMAVGIIGAIRAIVDRKAFDYIVEGMVNSNSRMHQKLPALQKLVGRFRRTK